jgi:hypothetical protein
MATVKLEDGSVLELETPEELVLFLQATGKTVAPKSQAEVIAEKMIELRTTDPAKAEAVSAAADQITAGPLAECGSAVREAAEVIRSHEDNLQAALRESAELELAYQEANDTGAPVELGNFLVMPGHRVLPKHVRPGSIPPPPRRHIPFTKRELEVMNVLKAAYPQYLTTAQIAERMGETVTSRISCLLSNVFTAGRGLKKGTHRTWTVEAWAVRSTWVLDGTPSRRWPPKEEGDTQT